MGRADGLAGATGEAGHDVLRPEPFARHIERFNATDQETVIQFISNAQSWSWLREQIPLFECPDPEVEEIYYYRWWTFRKHIRETPLGFVVTEFLTPVSHAGPHNTISCAAGHHLAEGRWLRDQRFLDDYVRFWYRSESGQPARHLHQYSQWLPAAVYDRHLVHPNPGLIGQLLEDMVGDYGVWERERLLPNGLFWQYDVSDGMEESISGSRRERCARPTINSYMFANAQAIARMSRLAGASAVAGEFERKAARLRALVQRHLWDPDARFFKVRSARDTLADVREAIGFIPWCFGLPEAGYESAWAQLTDPLGFQAPYGVTTAERRHPAFRSHGCCQCEWDGAVWPFATSQTLTALANVLRDYPPAGVTQQDFFDAFLTYVRCHRYEGQPYIGEYLDETTGQWLKGRLERSRHYNHSTFADLLIAGVIGLRPRADNRVEVDPLLPEGAWDWFALDGIRYHGRRLTIFWDRNGQRYGRGRGLSVLANGQPIATSGRLRKTEGSIP